MTKNHHPSAKQQAMIQWARVQLASHGYALKHNEPEDIQMTPWSYVVRFDTQHGYVYFKHTPALLALEAQLIMLLKNTLDAPVPTIIAHHDEWHCFLMKDAGKTLRSHLKTQFDTALACKTIHQFTSLQIKAAAHINTFIELGVPDWRLQQLPHLYKEIIAQKDLLENHGLTESEIETLKSLTPKIAILCDELSGYAIEESLAQPDFNDNNTLVNENTHHLTIIDLGELSISHPFFSMVNFLYVMKKHHALNESDAEYEKLKNACLDNYTPFESKKRLLEAFETANTLMPVYSLLSYHRLMRACHDDIPPNDRSQKLTAILQALIATLIT